MSLSRSPADGSPFTLGKNNTMHSHIYLGTGSYVVCLDKRSGKELWRTKLKKTGLLTIAVVDDLVVAHARGSVYGLSKNDGVILWENGLPGLGYNYCIIASDSMSNEASVTQQNVTASIVAERMSD